MPSALTAGVEETFAALAEPELRDWLHRHRTGRGTYPLVGYHRFVADTADRYLRGLGADTAPLSERAQRMLDGVHTAAADAVTAEGVRWEPLDGQSRAIAGKYRA